MPVCQSMYRLAYGSAGLEVQPAVKVIGAYLAEVTGKDNRKIERGRERCLLYVGPVSHRTLLAHIHLVCCLQKTKKRKVSGILYSYSSYPIF